MPNRKPLRWGVMSAARIANKFCEGVKTLPDSELHAIAARDLNRAQEFAAKWHIPKAYGSYDEMLGDADSVGPVVPDGASPPPPQAAGTMSVSTTTTRLALPVLSKPPASRSDRG